MSINPTLKNEQLAAYLATDDSVQALEKAVENGQTRLALQVALDLLSELTERVMDLEDIVNSVNEESSEQAELNENKILDEPVLSEESSLNQETKNMEEPATTTKEVEQAKNKPQETKVPK